MLDKTFMGKIMGLMFTFLSLISFGQLVEPIQFQDKTHDFGEVAEYEGSVTYDFSFINKSSRAIKILSVQPSCGCTTPGWTKEPIEPGKIGTIKAKFDPKGRPGYFNKSLTITTDFDANQIVLQIKGNVVDKKSTVAPYDLVVANGSLRLRNTSFNVGKVYINKSNPIVEFPVYNDSNDTIKFLEVKSPPYIKFNLPTLAPNSKNTIKIMYDAKLKNQYGFVSDNIVLKTSDHTQPEKSFSIYATIEESFPLLSPEEQAKAPVLLADDYLLDLGKIKNGMEVTRTIKIKNSGHRDLQIKYMQSNCSCLVVQAGKMTLKPTEETNIEFRFDPTGRESLQNKAVTIYSNDPVNPVQRISVKGYINQH